jgi:hypothetical protein
MIYIKAFLLGVAMFILTFALALGFMMRHAFVPPPAVPASAEVSFDLNSAWVDTPAWPPLLAGMAGFAGAFHWTLKRSRR